MKKLLMFFFAICFLSGCAYDKLTTINAKGDSIIVPIGNFETVKAKNATLNVTREVHLSGKRTENVPTLSNVNIINDANNKGTLTITK